MRSQQFRDGSANACRKAVKWLHREADAMNDPRAKQLLNGAAFGLGLHFAGRCAWMAEPASAERRPAKRDPCA